MTGTAKALSCFKACERLRRPAPAPPRRSTGNITRTHAGTGSKPRAASLSSGTEKQHSLWSPSRPHLNTSCTGPCQSPQGPRATLPPAACAATRSSGWPVHQRSPESRAAGVLTTQGSVEEAGPHQASKPKRNGSERSKVILGKKHRRDKGSEGRTKPVDPSVTAVRRVALTCGSAELPPGSDRVCVKWVSRTLSLG